MRNENYCIFCGSKRTDIVNVEGILEEQNTKWTSLLGLYFFPPDGDLITVCPACREKKTIAQLYDTVIEAKREEAAKEAEAMRERLGKV